MTPIPCELIVDRRNRRCGLPATLHLLIDRIGIGHVRRACCIGCLGLVARKGRLIDGLVLDHHPLARPDCPHPSATWDGDRCVIGTVDDLTLEQLTDAGQAVPA